MIKFQIFNKKDQAVGQAFATYQEAWEALCEITKYKGEYIAQTN